jgi:hypothetical protein
LCWGDWLGSELHSFAVAQWLAICDTVTIMFRGTHLGERRLWTLAVTNPSHQRQALEPAFQIVGVARE